MKYLIAITGINLLTGLSSPPAYLDPGSGSFILQLLIASAVGIMFALRGYWSKLISLFKKSKSEDSEDKE